MIHMKKLVCLALCLALCASMLAGCGGSALEKKLSAIAQLGESPDDNCRVYYEIFVYSFCDSNGDGIGDLQGVISKLDYLQELGINGIWLMPIHPSTTYHKYNVADYYAIDPAYGTMADFEQLLSACNERGIRVIMDLVVNHSGSDHPWFTAACEYLASLEKGAEPDSSVCPYVEYYHFSTEVAAGYNNIPGSWNWFYECQFSSNMPDLNWGCQSLRQEIRQIMTFWLDKGVAGFRLDAAKEFYSGNGVKNTEVLKWLQDTAVSIKEDAYLVAEVWDTSQTISNYYESGITSIFNYPYGDGTGGIIRAIRGAGRESVVSNFATTLQQNYEKYAASNPNFIDAPFLSNHDVGRIYGFTAKDEAKTKLAAAMNLFMSGSCFIYYGEEIGMLGSGDDPSKRAPMVWDSVEAAPGTTTPPPGCTVPSDYPLGGLAQQRDAEYSLYNYYRQAIAIRKALPVISHGSILAEEALNTGCVSAMRKVWGEEACLILMNINSETAQVDLSEYEGWVLAASLEVDEVPTQLAGGSLTLPPWAVAVLVPK